MNSENQKPSAYQRVKAAYEGMVFSRRRYARAPLRVKVTTILTELFEFFVSSDISLGGMFLKAESPYAIGAIVKLEFSLPDRDKKMSVEGKVIRVVQPDNPRGLDSGMGIKFARLSRADHNLIKKYVKENKKKSSGM